MDGDRLKKTADKLKEEITTGDGLVEMFQRVGLTSDELDKAMKPWERLSPGLHAAMANGMLIGVTAAYQETQGKVSEMERELLTIFDRAVDLIEKLLERVSMLLSANVEGKKLRKEVVAEFIQTQATSVIIMQVIRAQIDSMKAEASRT